MIGDIHELVGIDEAMPYGGIPYNTYIPKFEKTGMDSDILPYELQDDYDPYTSYARSEIIDWSTDAPLFESDHTRRETSHAKSSINLRLNGNRGNTSDLPRHPELFYGFTGNDPRGASNDPRFDNARAFTTAHVLNIEPSMGKNDDNHEAERPWTNQSISYDKKYIQQLTANSLKIFSSEKEGRPYSRNVTADQDTWGQNQGKIRKSNMDAVTFDKLAGDYTEYIEIGGQVNEISGRDMQIKDIESIINKFKTDQDFTNNQNNLHIGSGNNKLLFNMSNTKTDHIDIDSISNINTNGSAFNKQSLAATMGLAAKTAALAKQGMSNYKKNGMNATNDKYIAEGNDMDNIRQGSNVGHDYSNNITEIYKKIENGQNYKDSTEQKSQGQGQTQIRTTDINKKTIFNKLNNLEMTNIIVKGLKENTASSKRKIANEIITQKSMAVDNNNIETTIDNAAGLTPAKYYNKNIDGIDSTIFKKYITKENAVNKFQPAPKQEKRVSFGQQSIVMDWKDHISAAHGKQAVPQYDYNTFNKGKIALEPTNWKNSKEMQILKNTNPVLYEKVRRGMEMSVMEWKDSDIANYGKVAHEIQPNIMKIGGQTYDPDVFNIEYNEQIAKKNQALSNRRSALDDPIELGTHQDEIFQSQKQSFSYGASMTGKPKTLRSGAWNGADYVRANELNDHY